MFCKILAQGNEDQNVNKEYQLFQLPLSASEVYIYLRF